MEIQLEIESQARKNLKQLAEKTELMKTMIWNSNIRLIHALALVGQALQMAPEK